MLVARIFDAFVDPVVGILSDRTNTRWGKYRPWLLWTAIPFAVFFILAFTTPDLSERGKIIYAGITYTLLMSIYSFNNTPYASLGGVMTSDIKERTSISSVRFVTAYNRHFCCAGAYFAVSLQVRARRRSTWMVPDDYPVCHHRSCSFSNHILLCQRAYHASRRSENFRETGF